MRSLICLPIVALLLASCDQRQSTHPSSNGEAQNGKQVPNAIGNSSDVTKVSEGANAAGPKLVVENATITFQPLWVGTPITDAFILKNAGNELLKITSVKPHCACTASKDYTRDIAPGETGRVPFTVNTTNKAGDIEEYLAITTNDPANPEMRLYVKGFVKTVCHVEVISDSSIQSGRNSTEEHEKIKRLQGYFGQVKADDKPHRVLKLTNTSGQPLSLTLLSVLQQAPLFSASLKETVPQQEFELTIEGKPPFPVGESYANVSLKTDIPGKESYVIPVSIYVPPRIEVIPHKIVANDMSYKAKVRPIRITNYGSTPVKVTSVAVSDPTYGAKLLPTDPAKPNQTVVEVTLPPGEYRPPPYGEIIRIQTNDSEKPLIEMYALPDLHAPPTPRPADKPLKWHEVPI